MVTTFFGAESFGGDAAYVHRLSEALLRRGHEVHVVHCADAFAALRRGEPLRQYSPPRGLHVHRLASPIGPLSPLWTHQTGRLGPKAKPLRRILAAEDFDVVHLHNVSLVGGPALLSVAPDDGRAVKIMTAHEYWLGCPMHLLWKLGREPCERPQCVRCTLAGGRPPQLWRSTGALDRSLDRLDALICPSRWSLQFHDRFADRVQLVHLPHFVGQAWAGGTDATNSDRPYVAGAGRLVVEKGFQDAVAVMARLPELDLRIAGAGPYAGRLRELAADLPNVRFEGLLPQDAVVGLFRSARAVVVPTLYPEPFGYVALEALSVGTPVVVHDRGGLPELVEDSGGGMLYRTREELETALRTFGADEELRSSLGQLGAKASRTIWSEAAHVQRYLDLVAAFRGSVSAPERRHPKPAPA
jgi:glycosyltransferase involved in cell wall biosynthesis